MRALLLVVVPLLLSGVALAQDGANNTTSSTSTAPADVAITMLAHADGSSYYWTKEGDTAHNPTLSIPAGAHVTVTVKDTGDQTHNFGVDSEAKASDYVSAAGDTATYAFTMPNHGISYFCVPHKGSGMTGKINVADAGGASAAPAPAPTAAPTAFTIVGHAEGSSYFWTLEGQTAHNPTITVAPDTDITVTVKNAGDTPHNFQVGTNKGSDYVNGPTDVVSYTFHSGADGTSDKYQCQPHGGSGMNGVIKFAKTLAAAAPAEAGAASGVLGTGAINGNAADLGTAASDPKCSGMQIPEATANKEVGGPTVEDYKKRCEEPASALGEQVRPTSGADYVIPLSFALIGVGVVAVVYVHKFYRP